MWRPVPKNIKRTLVVFLTLSVVSGSLGLLTTGLGPNLDKNLAAGVPLIGLLSSIFLLCAGPKELPFLKKRAKGLPGQQKWIVTCKIRHTKVLIGSDSGIVVCRDGRLRFLGVRTDIDLPNSWLLAKSPNKTACLVSEVLSPQGERFEITVEPMNPSLSDQCAYMLEDWKALQLVDRTPQIRVEIQPELRRQYGAVMKPRLAMWFLATLLGFLACANRWGLNFYVVTIFLTIFAFEIGFFCMYAFSPEWKKRAVVEKKLGI